MGLSNKLPTNVIRILIETDTGVAEYVVRILEQADGISLETLGVRLTSGQFSPASPRQLRQAFLLHFWAEQHQDVFAECRVMP